MDIVWIIIDGLSYSATPFADDGPETLPRLKRLADSRGAVFSNAYAPGPLSPSSHAAMFTGKLPSQVGMHEAHPYYESESPTVATALSGEYETHLVTGNEWLFQGLDADFDETFDFGRQYMVYRDGLDPSRYFHSNVSRLRDFLADAREDGTLFESTANALKYKLGADYGIMPKNWGDSENYQYAGAQSAEIRERVESPGDTFVLANYMDVHAPIEVSEEALENVTGSIGREELPVAVSPERHIPDDEKSYDVDRMERLYRAAVYDIDRKVSPLVRDLVENDTFVVFTSDHGRVDTSTAYSDTRLHVPLVLFGPDVASREVTETVNTRSIPATISDVAGVDTVEFEGSPLCDVTDDQLSITEIIHHPNDIYYETHRVDITRLPDRADSDIQHDLVLHRGETEARYIGEDWSVANATSEEKADLRDLCESIRETDLSGTSKGGIEYDPVTERRLEDLGYL